MTDVMQRRHLRLVPEPKPIERNPKLHDDPTFYQRRTIALLKAVDPLARDLRPLSVECARTMAKTLTASIFRRFCGWSLLTCWKAAWRGCENRCGS